MFKIWLNCAVVVVLVASQVLGAPQQRRLRPSQQQPQQLQHQLRQQQRTAPAAYHHEEQAHNLDPNAADEGMTREHAKLIENLQRLKRTLDHVKERVGKGTYGETAQVDVQNPEGAILTVLKSLQEQGQLFAMINDMLKAGNAVQNQTEKIEAYSKHHEQARAEAAHADNTNQLSIPSSSAVPSISAPSANPSYASRPTQASPAKATSRKQENAGKHHGYDDYQYQYKDDSGDATGEDDYQYHYDAQGYDEEVSTTTSTTTRRPPTRRLRTRSRNEYY